MLSQRSMQRFRPALPGLPGLALLGLLALGCGQSEGSRCQIDSDCSSGLVCTKGETGNGACTRPGSGSGQPSHDASPDRTPAAADVEPDSATPDSPAPDTATSFDNDVSPDRTPAADVGIDVEPDSATPDSPGPDLSYDTGTSPDQTPAAAEVEPDSAEKDTARSHDTVPASTETDAPRSEAGAIDTMGLG
jgi:hypothetical protein